VPVLPGDDPDMLAARVLTMEHRLYPRALGLVAAGRAWVEDELVVFDSASTAKEALLLG